MITQECTILRQEPTVGLQEPSQIPAQETGFGEGPIGVLILLAHDIRDLAPDPPRTELIAKILREFEEAGDAMRYLDVDGRIAWKATPRILSRLADAEREAMDDLAECP
jgi:hypothetical protein